MIFLAELRVRACCDVATANAVSYLASEGEHISYNGLFLWSCRKCGIRGREGPGDTHNTLQGKCGRKDGAGESVQDDRHRNYCRPEAHRITWKSCKVLMSQELWI